IEYYAIDNRIVTVLKGGEARIRISRPQNSRQLLLWGSIPAGHPSFSDELPEDDPALFAAEALYDALARRAAAIIPRISQGSSRLGSGRLLTNCCMKLIRRAKTSTPS